MSEQLSLFADHDLMIDQPEPYEKGDRVLIQLTVTEEEDLESFYYLQEFAGKKGDIKNALKKRRLQYEVEFGDKQGLFYHEELIYLG